MSIINSRVDDRLVHGQVATSWIRGLQIQVVVVVDDEIAKDSAQKAILKMAAPAETKVYALSVDGFLERYRKGILDKYRVMLVFANVYAPLELVKKGFELKELNLGGMRFRDGRKQITKSLSVNLEEEKIIKELIKRGVHVEHRQLSTDESFNVEGIL